MAGMDLENQYHYWPDEDAFDAWNVARLIRLVEGLPVIEVALDDLREIDTNYWFHAGHEPTVRNVAMHVVQATREVDPTYPVILGPDNRVMDGMHRILRALLDGQTHISAVRLETLPPADVRNVPLGGADTFGRNGVGMSPT